MGSPLQPGIRSNREPTFNQAPTPLTQPGTIDQQGGSHSATPSTGQLGTSTNLSGATSANQSGTNVQALTIDGLQDKTTDVDLPLSQLVPNNVDVIASVAPGIKQLLAVRLSVSNKTQVPLIVDGDHATLQRGATDANPLVAAPQAALDAIGHPPTTFGKKFITDARDVVLAGISVGAIPTVETFKEQFGPIEKRYGYDEDRRAREQTRFGKRVLYPGDTSSGNVYFKVGSIAQGMTLRFPIKSFYSQSNQVVLSTTISGVVTDEANPTSKKNTPGTGSQP